MPAFNQLNIAARLLDDNNRRAGGPHLGDPPGTHFVKTFNDVFRKEDTDEGKQRRIEQAVIVLRDAWNVDQQFARSAARFLAKSHPDIEEFGNLLISL